MCISNQIKHASLYSLKCSDMVKHDLKWLTVQNSSYLEDHEWDAED